MAWQTASIERAAALRSRCAADDLALVTAEIVHDDDVAGAQRRQEHPFDIGGEAFAIDRAVDEPGGFDAVVAQGGQEGHGLPAAVRNLGFEPRACW